MLAAKEQAWLSHSSHDIFFEVENMTIISKAYKYVYIYISIYMYTHIYMCMQQLPGVALGAASVCWKSYF